jgi:hypothetical protein
MPKNTVSDPITDQEMAFAHLILSGTMNDHRAAEAVGLNPETVAYAKSKPRVRAYIDIEGTDELTTIPNSLSVVRRMVVISYLQCPASCPSNPSLGARASQFYWQRWLLQNPVQHSSDDVQYML